MEQVLDIVEQDPEVSVRGIENMFGIPKSSANDILRKFHIHPFHFTPVHNIIDVDHVSRVNYCNDMLELMNEEDDVLRKILWTDESTVTNVGCFNFHNSHYYSHENPHKARVNSFQHR